MNTTCTRSLWSVIVVFLRFVLTKGVISNSKFVVVEDVERNAANVYQEAAADSIVMCARFCHMSKDCTAVNYNPNNRMCSLVNMDSLASEYAPGWKLLFVPTAERTFRHITDRQETWDGAKSYCESIGGRLANINTQTDQEMILNVVNPSVDTRVWIGGSDKDNEGDWIWSNGCRFDDQVNHFWRNGEPDNHGSGQDCLELVYQNWNDQFCSNMQSFVCEIQVD